MPTELRAWDWEIEAAAMAARALGPPDSEERAVTDPKLRTQVVNTIRMTAAAWSVVHRKAPSPRSIATVLAEDNDMAWLMENAIRRQARNASERHAIKEITAWYKQEWRTVQTASYAASGRLGYQQQVRIIHLTSIAANNAGTDADTPLKQLKHGSAERQEAARKLGIIDLKGSEEEREARNFAEELVSTLEAEAKRLGTDGATMTRLAWCARQALHRSRRRQRT